jgi:hypothetical protein
VTQRGENKVGFGEGEGEGDLAHREKD